MLKSFLQGKIFNLILVYAGWIICLHEVVHGHPLAGTLAVCGILLIHFTITDTKEADFKLLLAMALFGTVLDSFYIFLGLIQFTGGYVSWLAPLWVSALWALLSISINHSMTWMRDSLGMAAVFGGIGAPATYLAGVKLGAGVFSAPMWFSLGTIGIAWFFALPFLFKLSDYLKRGVG